MTMKYAGGEILTEFLLTMSGLAPCRILDLGAGSGETIRLLREQGYFAQGIDETGNEDVEPGDILHCHYEDGSFDAVISEGVLFGTGRETEGWAEALRLLKTGGTFLLADVCFTDVRGHVDRMQKAGFQVEHVEEATALWGDCGYLEQVEQLGGKGRCRYFLSVCTKP